MSNETKTKTKRAAKRYPYPRAAQAKVDGQILEIQMLNISTSGVQFAARIKITTPNPILLMWKDTRFGTFNPTVLMAREIHKPENTDFQYYYGSQYYNLNAEVKQNLLVLLKTFKDEDKQEIKKQVEKITPKYLFEVIEQGSSFLRNVFAGGGIPSYFDNIIKEIKDYERAAFFKEDPLSICVQKLTTHNFHCNLFGMLTPFMTENGDLQAVYFSNIQYELQKIAETEIETEATMKSVMQGEGSEEDKKNTQRMMNESNNRLFYTKQGLLQSVVETFIHVETGSDAFNENFGKIKAEYQHISEFTNAAFHEETQTYKRRSKKPAEYSRADAIVDVPVLSYSKPRYLLFFNIFLIIVLTLSIGFYQFTKFQRRNELKDLIGLQIDVKRFEKLGTQIDLTVPADQWSSLPVSHKIDSFNKIVSYLLKDKSARSCILFDTNSNIIKILYEDTPMIENVGMTPK